MKKWCKHILWTIGEYSGGHFRIRAYTEGMIKQQHSIIADKWNLCPICGARRPKRKVKGKQ